MDARTYLDKYGDVGVGALIKAVNKATGRETTLGYFKQIAYGHRRPSLELAEDYVAHDPKKRLDVMSLLKSRKRPPEARDAA